MLSLSTFPPAPKSPKSQDTRKASPRAPHTKVSKSKSQSAAATAAAAVAAASAHAAQYPNTTAYLIDRMFAGSAGDIADSPRSDASHVREGSDSPAARGARHVQGGQGVRPGQPEGRRGRPDLPSPPPPPPPRAPRRFLLLLLRFLQQAPPCTSRSRSAAARPTAAAETTPRSPVGVNPVKSPRTPPEQSRGGPRPFRRATAGALGRGVGVGGNGGSSSSSPPDELPALPAATSPVGDQEDKVSEAGTYTIEAEEDGEEELLGPRQQIDEVFGVDVDSFSIERPVIGSTERLAAAGEEEEEGGEEGGEEGEERTLHEEAEDEDLGPGLPHALRRGGGRRLRPRRRGWCLGVAVLWCVGAVCVCVGDACVVCVCCCCCCCCCCFVSVCVYVFIFLFITLCVCVC